MRLCAAGQKISVSNTKHTPSLLASIGVKDQEDVRRCASCTAASLLPVLLSARSVHWPLCAMDQIIPGLWIGDLACALATDYLSTAGVTHIVTAMKQSLPTPISLPDGRQIDADHVYHINIDDVENAPILVHFPGAIEFIDGALRQQWIEDDESAERDEALEQEQVAANSRTTPPAGKGVGQWATTGEGTVFVHCHAGISRSVAVVVAYLMHMRQMSVQAALALVRSRRSMADPNAGFMHQLELYESASYNVDVRNQRIRRFLMSQASILRGDPIDDVMLSYYPSPLHSPASSLPGSLHGGVGGSLQFSAMDEESKATGASSKTRGTDSVNSSPTNSGRNSAAMSLQNGRIAASIAAAKGATERHRNISKSEGADGISQSSSPDSLTVDLSKSPPMPNRSQSLFDEDDGDSCSKRDEKTHRLIRQTFTSVDEPHEVMITVNSGNLPGGVRKVRGNQNEPSSVQRPPMNGRRGLVSTAQGQQRLPKPHFGAMKLRCKMCRRELAARDHVVEHEPGKGKDAFDVRKRAKDVEQKSRDGRAAMGVGTGTEEPRDGEMTMEEKFGARTRSDEEVVEGKMDGAPTASSANAQSTYKSAASLSAQLPPHLAALRLGRSAAPSVQTTSTNTSNGTAQPAPPAAAPPTNAAQPAPSQPDDLRKMLHSAKCTSYFVEPLAWMSALQLGEVAGRLDCPNTRCAAKLGSWDWAGMQCAW